MLIPLIGSAVVPIQITITILLLRSSAGRMTAEPIRLPLTASLLLVLGALRLVLALRQLLHQPDEDAPPSG